jgi:hypothetical protein
LPALLIYSAKAQQRTASTEQGEYSKDLSGRGKRRLLYRRSRNDD